MAITVTGKMNKAATERATNSGDAMFLVNVGKKERNRQSQQDEWVNYSAAVFAKQGGQADFYRNVLQPGAIVSLSGSGVLPRIWGDANDKVGLDIMDARLEYAANPEASQQAPQQQRQPQQSYQQQAPQQQAAPQQAPANNFADFDDDIPFSNYELKTLV